MNSKVSDKATHSFVGVAAFIEAIAALRHPKSGCPWDLAQDHLSLTKYLLEESNEFIEALESEGPSSPQTWEELGDVLLQVGLHCQLGKEKNLMDFDTLALQAAEKIRLRHPHVFDPNFPKFKTPQEVSEAWESIKSYARSQSTQKQAPKTTPADPTSFFEIPQGLPALLKAQRVGEKAASIGFDWNQASDVLGKIAEETQELLTAKSESEQIEEAGDLLFAICQWLRIKSLDGEQVLNSATAKFRGRFNKILGHLKDKQIDPKTLSPEDWDSLWIQAK